MAKFCIYSLMEHINNMGYTLSQLQSMGATFGQGNEKDASTSAYQDFVSKNVPTALAPKSPTGASNPLINGTDPRLQGLPSTNTSGNFISSLPGAIKDTGTELKNDVVQPLQDSFENKQGGFSAGLQGVGNLLNTTIVKPGNEALAPITKAWQGLTSILNPVVDTLSGQSQGSTEQANAQATKQAADKYNQWATVHPEAAKNLEALGNIGQAGLTVEGAEGAIEGAKAGIDSVTEPKIPTQSLQNIQASANPTSEIPTKASTDTAKPEDTLSSRIQDATPEYNAKMVGKNVMTPDTTDAQGKVIKGQITPRIASEGKGLTGERPVTVSASEHASGTELNNIKDYPDKGTALDKMLSAQKANGNEAETMRSGLRAEDKATPLDTTAEKTKVADLVKSRLPKEIQDKIGYLSKDNPLSKLGVKDNPQTPLNKALQEMNASPEESLPKTAAGRYYQKVLNAVKEYDGTREGKLNLRQTLDEAYKDARGKLAFGSDSQNALDETHSDIRDDVNKDLHSSTKNVDTQASLKKQTNLYRAMDVLQEKAQAEASTHYGKFVQEHPMAQKAVGILSRQGIMIPVRILESAAGLGLVYAAAKSLTSK